MRTGPLVDALIEHLVGDLGRYALENSFHVVVECAAGHFGKLGEAMVISGRQSNL
jgi:hypothetical protein